MRVGIIHSDRTIIELLKLVVENEGFEAQGLDLVNFIGVRDLVPPINKFLTEKNPSVVLFDIGSAVKYHDNIELYKKVKETNIKRIFVPIILGCEEKEKVVRAGEREGIKFNYVCNAGNTTEIGGLIRIIEEDTKKIAKEKETKMPVECFCKRSKECEP
ncbi:hypothetical protein C4559_02985 [Candidatus Microgenomates bacterium]|nr:MAG: hypothetical protein C4559_02985 [Candidatus Microgenomates bacterium]